MGKFDIPAMIKSILKATGKDSSLSVVCHSAGCIPFFIAMIVHPKLNAKVDLLVALAPLTVVNHSNNMLKIFISQKSNGFAVIFLISLYNILLLNIGLILLLFERDDSSITGYIIYY